jgi:hypothetical protein
MCGSGRQLGAALTATRGKDGATGAGPHAGAEAVRTTAAPVARLERALAHGTLPMLCVVARPQAHGNGRLRQRPVYFTRQSKRGANRVQREPIPPACPGRHVVPMTSSWTPLRAPFCAATSTNGRRTPDDTPMASGITWDEVARRATGPLGFSTISLQKDPRRGQDRPQAE